MPVLPLGGHAVVFTAVRPKAERSNGVVQNISEAYIDAIRPHAAQVRLGDDGELYGYIAGPRTQPSLDALFTEFQDRAL